MPTAILSLSFRSSLLASHLPPPSPSSPHPILHLPSVGPCVSQRPELRLWGGETETLHCVPGWKREHWESQHHRIQRLLLLRLLFLLFVTEQAALPGLRLYIRRGPVYQSAASWPLRAPPYQREQRNRKWEQLTDQPPFRLCVWLLPLSTWWQ